MHYLNESELTSLFLMVIRWLLWLKQKTFYRVPFKGLGRESREEGGRGGDGGGGGKGLEREKEEGEGDKGRGRRGGGGGTGTQLPSASVCLRPGKEITHQAGSEKGIDRSGDRARLCFAESLQIEQAVASVGLPTLRTVHPSWTQASGTPGVRLSVRSMSTSRSH